MVKNGDMPAMPMVMNDYDHVWCEGLTKREKFAMAAMQGLLANHAIIDTLEPCGYVADTAVSHADALLAALDEDK